MANLLFRLYSWLILGYFWQRRVFVRLFILTLRYVRDARARLLLTIDTHAHVSMDATLSVHVKVISYDRNGHVSTKCKDFQNKKNRKRKKITRPWNEVRSHVVGYIIYTCIYCIKDTMFHDVLDSFFIRCKVSRPHCISCALSTHAFFFFALFNNSFIRERPVRSLFRFHSIGLLPQIHTQQNDFLDNTTRARRWNVQLGTIIGLAIFRLLVTASCAGKISLSITNLRQPSGWALVYDMVS